MFIMLSIFIIFYQVNDMIKKPWLKYYGDSPEFVTIPDKTTYSIIRENAERYPHHAALYYLGSTIGYRKFLKQIDRCAAAFSKLGIGAGDSVTICAPNIPQTVIAFYALSKIGAVASMLFPLAGEKEVYDCLSISNSKAAVILDLQYKNFVNQIKKTNCEKLIILKVQDYLPKTKKTFLNIYDFFQGKKKITSPDAVYWWSFMRQRGPIADPFPKTAKDPSIILYSGGTTGKPKGIVYNDFILNAAVTQAMAMLAREDALKPGDAFLAVLPTFHCFGLAIGVHAPMMTAGISLLIPKPANKFIYQAMKYKCPKIMSGVPTLFKLMLESQSIWKLNLSPLKGIFCGGDKIPETLKNRLNIALKKAGCTKTAREGYGLTECAPPCAINPDKNQEIGSIGIPCANVLAKVVEPGTEIELPYGTDGELCVSAPTNMLYYLNEPEETAQTKRMHKDGHEWIHTGDICSMSENGFIFFKLRQKRMIKVSGICVYPTLVEEILQTHKAVKEACVVKIPHQYKLNVLKAYIILNENMKPSAKIEKELQQLCRKEFAPQSCPKEFEFLSDFPRTKVGKTDFMALERMAREKANVK